MTPRAHSMPLLSKAERIGIRAGAATALPMTVAALAGFELIAHCDRCGRHLRLHPGPLDLDPRTSLQNLLKRHVCRARRNGRECGGHPRRLILTREGHAVPGSLHHATEQWVLDESGAWIEETAAFWEDEDFDALTAR